jgi:D-methionine transport system substrate-binding protein
MHSPTRRTFLAGALTLTAGGTRAAVPFRVVAFSVPHAEILEFVGRTLAPDFPLKLIVTRGGIRPNALLRHGDADANFFQHEPFLHAEEAQLGVTFAVVPAVHIEPLGIYSRRVATLAEVPQGRASRCRIRSRTSAAA